LSRSAADSAVGRLAFAGKHTQLPSSRGCDHRGGATVERRHAARAASGRWWGGAQFLPPTASWSHGRGSLRHRASLLHARRRAGMHGGTKASRPAMRRSMRVFSAVCATAAPARPASGAHGAFATSHRLAGQFEPLWARGRRFRARNAEAGRTAPRGHVWRICRSRARLYRMKTPWLVKSRRSRLRELQVRRQRCRCARG
jgi:hypothetical protein